MVNASKSMLMIFTSVNTGVLKILKTVLLQWSFLNLIFETVITLTLRVYIQKLHKYILTRCNRWANNFFTYDIDLV